MDSGNSYLHGQFPLLPIHLVHGKLTLKRLKSRILSNRYTKQLYGETTKTKERAAVKVLDRRVPLFLRRNTANRYQTAYLLI